MLEYALLYTRLCDFSICVQDIVHVEDRVDPVDDLEIITGELRQKDIDMMRGVEASLEVRRNASCGTHTLCSCRFPYTALNTNISCRANRSTKYITLICISICCAFTFTHTHPLSLSLSLSLSLCVCVCVCACMYVLHLVYSSAAGHEEA